MHSAVIDAVLAAAPILILVALMVGAGWGAAKAGPAALIVALAIAAFWFGAGPRLLAFSQAKGALLSIWVLFIIWAALFLYYVVDQTGSIGTIGRGLAQVTSDRSMQVLILAWAFTSFLQGVAGYGVPVAVVAPLMVGAGFAPVTAVVATSIGHSWSVTFGSLAASYFALAGITGLGGTELAVTSAALLGLVCLLCGLGAVWAFSGARGVGSVLLPLVAASLLMGAVQILLAWAGLYSVAAFAAGTVGLLFLLVVARGGERRRIASGDGPQGEAQATVSAGQFAVAFSAYAILIAIVLISSFVPFVSSALGAIKLNLVFPGTETAQGWVNEAVKSFRPLSPFGDTGALLAYAAIGGYFAYRWLGMLEGPALTRAFRRTAGTALSSSIGIASMVGMAMAMTDGGMTNSLARALADVAGGTYPAVAPFIGVLGSFMTGSNTNSNVLFGALQRDSANALGMPAPIILAAQTAGGAIGSMLAPAKIVVGCSTVGLAGQEGPVLRRGVLYGLVITLLVGVACLIWVALR